MSEEGYFKKPEMTKPPESLTRDETDTGLATDADDGRHFAGLNLNLDRKSKVDKVTLLVPWWGMNACSLSLRELWQQQITLKDKLSPKRGQIGGI